MANVSETQEGVVIKDLLLRVWHNMFLIVAVVIISALLGVGYTYVKKPVYTATVPINYTARLNDSTSDTVDNISIMKDLMQSVVDVSVSEIVLEEADYLYDLYLRSGKNLDNFIDYVINGNDSSLVYKEGTRIETKYYSLDQVSSKAVSSGDKDSGPKYIFNVSVKDADKKIAVEKARILVLSANRVTKTFFGYITTTLDELIDKTSEVSVTTNVSLKKNVLIFGVMGVVVALGIVYLKYALDKTATDKDELERITGTNVIAIIEDQEDK